MPDDLHPQVEDDPLAGPRHDVLANAVDRRADEQDADEREDELVQQRGVLQPGVEDPQHHLRPHETEDRGEDEEGRREDEVDAVRLHEPQEPAVHRQRRPALPGAHPPRHRCMDRRGWGGDHGGCAGG